MGKSQKWDVFVKIRLDPFLTKAVRQAKRGLFDSAIRLLEPEINRYRGFFSYYYLLGVLCLHVGDFGGAFTYLRAARNIKPHEALVLLGLAVLHLRRRETDRAADLYLEVLDRDERNKTARKALKIIRRFAGTDDLIVWIESGKYHRFYPPLPPVKPSFLQVLLIVLGTLLSTSGVLFVLNRLALITLPDVPALSYFLVKSTRTGFDLSALDWQERSEAAQIAGAYQYILTKTQIIDEYEQARALFTQYRDESAKVILNRILESNASSAIKTKARLLISYMSIPGFDTLHDRFSYSEVNKEPILYRDCYVIWRGVAANVERQQNSTSFNLLVGYDNRITLEGIVSVTFDFALPVNAELPLEVLGKIQLVQGERGLVMSLAGVAIHQLQGTASSPRS
ncbi:MAG: tetratricopeptide repeat protein [Spirochaetaceae bacterium]|jgi:tetratricopeptide (TPR) repeat protein|nr:tetratricopeptide repeat protein [Spirochaetaceae bacterium]